CVTVRANGGSRNLPGRHDAESGPATNTVGLEVIVVDREDKRQRFTFRKAHECCIGEVHGTVMVLLHQPVEIGSIRVRNGQKRHRARADKSPCSINISGMVVEKVENFG
ncbi:MAG: hypothetical protein OEU26_31735, partial [Candidatus Tectomicrobia bacterium]|nr:hypothetical protein [Candidatus Tectomicrobia bacterium]